MVRGVFETLSNMYEGAYLRKPLTVFTSSSNFDIRESSEEIPRDCRKYSQK